MSREYIVPTPDDKVRDIVCTYCMEAWQLGMLAEFKVEHDCTINYEGAVGGKYTIAFSNTALGQVVKCHCACGAWTDLTEYDW